MASAADQELIAAARSVVGQFSLIDEARAGGVGAALRTRTGMIFTGALIAAEFREGLTLPATGH
jgi:hypothetical protein